METNPIRYAVYIAALLAAAGTLLIDVSSGIALLEAAGKALLSLSLVAGGAEVARSRAYSPQRYDDDVDAHSYAANEFGR